MHQLRYFSEYKKIKTTEQFHVGDSKRQQNTQHIEQKPIEALHNLHQ